MAADSPPFADESYINLETFKRDGNGVKTPVWVAPLEGTLVVFSAGDAFKVKRLRRDPRVRVAACDVRGRVHGEWREGTGRVIEDAAQVTRAHAALRKKYGWQMAIGDFFAALTGRIGKRAYLELSLGSQSPS
jgi:PPOX class probable F420-dependent enzyme